MEPRDAERDDSSFHVALVQRQANVIGFEDVVAIEHHVFVESVDAGSVQQELIDSRTFGRWEPVVDLAP